jgi:hypothetical protein
MSSSYPWMKWKRRAGALAELASRIGRQGGGDQGLTEDRAAGGQEVQYERGDTGCQCQAAYQDDCKDDQEEADVLNMVELLFSPHDQPSSVDPGHVPGKRKCCGGCWHCLSPSQQEDCLAKMVFSGRKLAFSISTISKYRELVTSS